MSSRREADRRRAAGEERSVAPGEHLSRKARKAGLTSVLVPALNEFWIDGEGIDRQVLQIQITRYLGGEATCRPMENGVRLALQAQSTADILRNETGSTRLQYPSCPHIHARMCLHWLRSGP